MGVDSSKKMSLGQSTCVDSFYHNYYPLPSLIQWFSKETMSYNGHGHNLEIECIKKKKKTMNWEEVDVQPHFWPPPCLFKSLVIYKRMPWDYLQGTQ